MYQIVYGFFYVLSLLPWRVIYILSDGIALLLYYVFRYRRAVVMSNLLIAFPEKTEAERIRIAKDFYRRFVDNFLEVIKLISISEKELNKRFVCNYDVINNLYDTGVNVQLNLGHFFNWEFGNMAYAANLKYPLVVVYMPIKNKVLDRLFLHFRKRFGSKMIAATNFRNEFAPFAKNRYVLGLVGDQNPGSPENSYWANFFGRLTPVVKGPERGAKLNKAAVVMCNFWAVKRGYYQSELVLLTTDPNSLPNGAITKKMMEFIEESIRRHPSNYLWSHRRWKWQYDEEQHGRFRV